MDVSLTVSHNDGAPRPRFLLSSSSGYRRIWDYLIATATVYILIVTPYEVSFMSHEVMLRPTLAADLVMESLFVLDIILNFRTTYKGDSGEVVDVRLIALHYLRSWFLIDFVAALPIDLLHVFNIDVPLMVYLLKAVRLLRLHRLMQMLKNHLHKSCLVLTTLMVVFTLLAHWAACIWFLIGVYDLNTPNWHVGWLFELGERLESPYFENRTGGPSESHAYVGAMYFTLTSITTVGFGNMSPNTNGEKIFSIWLMLIGALMHSLIFGNVSAILYGLYARRSHYHHQMDELSRFINEHKVPKDIRIRMLNHAHTQWTPGTRNSDELLKAFPQDLHADILVHMFQKILGLPLFTTCNRDILRSLSLHIRPRSCVQGESLVLRGEAVKDIHLLCSGTMEVLGERNRPFKLLERGSLLGTELSDGETFRASVAVRAVGSCELQTLSVAGLKQVLQEYPYWAQVFSFDLQRHLTLDLQRSHTRISSEDSEDSEDFHQCHSTTNNLI